MVTKNISGIHVKSVAAGIATFELGDKRYRAVRRGVGKRGGWSLFNSITGLKISDIENLEQGVLLVKRMEGLDG